MSNIIDEAEAVAKVAGGVAAPWLIYAKIAGAVAVALAIAAGGYEVRGIVDAAKIAGLEKSVAEQLAVSEGERARTIQCQAIHEKARADGAESALSALNAATVGAAAAMDKLSQLAAARGKSLNDLLTEISNAPHTNVCGTSPAELAFRRGMQHRAEAPAAAAP